jgi:hypothetical protein
MKMQNNNILKGLNQNTLSQLVTVVNETIATTVTASAKNNFGAAELWNIQRMRKTQLVSNGYRNRFSVL